MSSRTVVGALSILLFCNEFITLNKLPFNYHFHPVDEDEPVDYRKGTYLISIKYFQHVLNKYDNPIVGDLVIVEGPEKNLQFRTVEAVSQTYYSNAANNFYYYVPAGFIVVKNPVDDSIIMQYIANVRGCDHYPIRW